MTKRSATGFTLLEISILIAVVGLLLGTYLSFFAPKQIMQSNVETQDKVARVMNALSNYALRLGTANRLPCPADPGEPDPNNFGLEQISVCNNPVGSGIIPYRTLGLSQEDARDGFGNFMTYMVERVATQNVGGSAGADSMTAPASRFCDGNPGAIRLFRDSFEDPDPNQRPVVVVISHGADGAGRYNIDDPSPGQRRFPYRTPTGAREAFNAVSVGAPDTTIDVAITDNQLGNTHFDDIVGMMTGPQVASRLNPEGCH